jgi:hypothetical protein
MPDVMLTFVSKVHIPPTRERPPLLPTRGLRALDVARAYVAPASIHVGEMEGVAIGGRGRGKEE